MTRKLYNIIQGIEYKPTDLGLRQGSFLDTFDITGQKKLFANPFGNYSSASLDCLLKMVNRKRDGVKPNQLTVDQAIQAIRSVQDQIDDDLASYNHGDLLEVSPNIIRDYALLKGYSLPEIREHVQALRNFVTRLEVDRNSMLGVMLAYNGNAGDYFRRLDVLPTFAIVASGNLGLFESGILIYSGILAQAAKNGQQFNLVIKPSIEDFLFNDLINCVPEPFRFAFNRLTWRSDVDWDMPLMSKLTNSVAGAIYFGQRSTLMGFKSQITDYQNKNHYFYYDHFPLMIIGENATEEQLKIAAEIAVDLAYKSKGEACLSLQDIFVHGAVNSIFMGHLKNQIRQINSGLKGTPLSKYSREFLERIESVQKRLLKSGATVTGKINPLSHTMEIMLADNLPIEHPILSRENAAPFLAVASYAKDDHLVEELLNAHLTPLSPDRSTDKHIYAIGLGIDESPDIIKYLEDHSHRLFTDPLDGKLQDFHAYDIGVPHCGGVSFLADMFSIGHFGQCYRHKQ